MAEESSVAFIAGFTTCFGNIQYNSDFIKAYMIVGWSTFAKGSKQLTYSPWSPPSSSSSEMLYFLHVIEDTHLFWYNSRNSSKLSWGSFFLSVCFLCTFIGDAIGLIKLIFSLYFWSFFDGLPLPRYCDRLDDVLLWERVLLILEGKARSFQNKYSTFQTF